MQLCWMESLRKLRSDSITLTLPDPEHKSPWAFQGPWHRGAGAWEEGGGCESALDFSSQAVGRSEALGSESLGFESWIHNLLSL